MRMNYIYPYSRIILSRRPVINHTSEEINQIHKEFFADLFDPEAGFYWQAATKHMFKHMWE